VSDPRERIVEIARFIYDRGLSDSAGGNISMREDGRLYVSPRFMGSVYRYRITPQQVSVLDEAHHVIEGPEVLSREVRMHLAVYRAFPEVGSVIHAHTRYMMVFAAAQRTMRPVLEYTDKFGDVECIPEVPAHSQSLADEVVRLAERRRDQLKRVAMGILLPRHGVAILGLDLDNAYDTLERLENNARVSLMSRLLPPEDAG
jgi:L-fuculose-phosphate aldolase